MTAKVSGDRLRGIRRNDKYIDRVVVRSGSNCGGDRWNARDAGNGGEFPITFLHPLTVIGIKVTIKKTESNINRYTSATTLKLSAKV